jgi:lincosamide nucleotidyltransferase A/C/D/E
VTTAETRLAGPDGGSGNGRAWYRTASRTVAHRVHRLVRRHHWLQVPLGWVSTTVGSAPAGSLPHRLLGPLRSYIRGEMDVGELHRILDALEAAGQRVWLAGGWGVDALAGVQSRTHDDLDVVLEDFDHTVAEAGKVLENLGYSYVGSDVRDIVHLPECSSFDDRRGHKVELLSMSWARLAADLGLAMPDGARGPLPRALAETVFTEGMVDGRRVPCVSARTQLFLHSDYKLQPKYRRDLAVINRPDLPARLNGSGD